MKIYTPIHDRGWFIEELESEDLKRLGNTHMVTRYRKHVGHFGTTYRDDLFFKSRESAQRWIDKFPVKKEEFFQIP